MEGVANEGIFLRMSYIVSGTRMKLYWSKFKFDGNNGYVSPWTMQIFAGITVFVVRTPTLCSGFVYIFVFS